MNSVGLITEYNPFHNGHKYHLEKAKEITNADAVIVIMSGDFLQRGEPSIINKWKRTELALLNGADLVIELPFFYSTQSAEIFAKGAVQILESLNVDNLVFGSELGDTNKICKVAKAYIDNEKEIDNIIKEEIKKGMSYPNAMSTACEKFCNSDEFLQPNNILAFEYTKEIIRNNLSINPIAIKRLGSSYYEKEIKDEISSATAIREQLKKGNLKRIKKTVPKSVYKLLKQEYKKDNLMFMDKYFEILKYKIITEYKYLDNIQDMEIGLANRFEKIIKECTNFQEFMKNVKTKRYTISRIYRVLCHILINLDKKITNDVKKDIPYIRVLGFNNTGSNYLNYIKKQMQVPIITNLKESTNKIPKGKLKFLEFVIKTEEIYTIISNENRKKVPIILNKQ